MSHKFVLWLKIIVLVFAGLAPAFMTDFANAAQISPRKVTISTSQSNASNVQYDYTFSTPTSAELDGIIFQFCTTPLGTCTLPNAMDVSNDLVTLDAHTNFPENTTTFAEVASNTGDCDDTGTANTVTMYCINRNSTTSGTATGATVDLGAILNPTISSGAYLTVYIRVSLYSDNTFTSKVHEGVVAAGITQQLTAVGRVAERLKFCVGAIQDNDSAPPAGETMPTDCDDTTNFPTNTQVDLGVIDETSVVTSPVNPSLSNANLANDRYGILQVNTNASAGIVITYYPEEASSVSAGDTDQLRAFRVIPTDCSATTTSTTDQCFVSDAAGSAITAGAEEFGMAVACINDTQGTTANLKPANGGVIGAAYVGDNDFDEKVVSTINDNCDNEDVAAYTWGFDISGTPATLAHTTNATVKVVDDEIIKLRFGATASATTPTGTYTVIITYIATPTF